MSTYTDFKSQVLGKGFNLDEAYGAQCWDGYAQYCRYLGVPYANCTNSGYVKDVWEQRHNNGILNHFIEVSDLQPGDVAVFREVAGWTPVSHIAIFDSDAGGGFGWFLGQNQGGAAYPGGGGVFNLTKFPYNATYTTAFRLKGTTIQPTGEAPVTRKYSESGTFTLTVDKINVRRAPSTKGEAVASYSKGQSVKYDTVIVDANGYVWISYIGGSGKRNYVATGVTRNGTRYGQAWGTFK